jgi:RNA polymerase sigma-70 factor, ECF subfamily
MAPLKGKGGPNSMEEVYLTTQSAIGVQVRIEALVSEYQTKLARYLRRMVGDSELALDLTQEVFLAAFRTLQRDPERPLTAGWLYKTATNGAI